MGYFSELDIEIRPGKDYLRLLNTYERDRELSPEEINLAKQDAWEAYGCPVPLTDAEVSAVLTDDIKSPDWEIAIKKLTAKSTVSPVTYAKRNNH